MYNTHTEYVMSEIINIHIYIIYQIKEDADVKNFSHIHVLLNKERGDKSFIHE